MWMLERYYDELTKNHPDRTQIQPVNITAAANWFYQDNPQEVWDYQEDFPMVVPPFQSMWMEFKAPNFINSEGNKKQFSMMLESVGCMSFCFELPSGQGRNAIEGGLLHRMFTEEADARGQRVQGDLALAQEKDKAALDAGHDPRWVAIWNIYGSTKQYRTAKFVTVAAYIDSLGRMIPENYIILGAWDVLKVVGSGPGVLVMPFLFATSLMHAKNVTLENEFIDPKIMRRRAKEGKPAITFKVLQINPIRRQADKEHSPGETGAKRAMHIVRGHFKDYREGAGLFGKLKGLYWWDMHVAGDKTNGQVIKDYTISKVSK